MDHVWKRVVRAINIDNRVRKFEKTVDGKKLMHWDFAIQSKKNRRMRRSLGTPGSVGNNGGESKAPAESVSPKRDP